MPHYFLLKSFTKLGALKHDDAFFLVGSAAEGETGL